MEQIKEENKKMTCPMCKAEGCQCIKKWGKNILLIVLGIAIGCLCASSMMRHGGYKHERKENKKMHMGHENMGMQNMMMDMTEAMKGKNGKDLEKVFLQEMVPHHQGAVDMAKMIVADPTTSKETKDFANQIITAQEKEITQMNDWLKKY